ncbi:MAG: hypothetical protein ACXAE3_17620, partial [Candidatus Kariarchaeaceae archaeon]
MLFDINFYMDFLSWADEAIVKVLHGVSDEEFTRDLGPHVGSIADKAGHLVGIYYFFIRALED